MRSGKVPAPETVSVGGRIVQMWTEAEIEHVRKLLPKIANGRKTRWHKQREAQKKKGAIKNKKGPRPKT